MRLRSRAPSSIPGSTLRKKKKKKRNTVAWLQETLETNYKSDYNTSYVIWQKEEEKAKGTFSKGAQTLLVIHQKGK